MNNGVQGPTGAAQRVPSASSEATVPAGAGLGGLSTAEEVIAEASAALDRQQAMARHARRIAREGQHEAAMNRIAKMRSAADEREWAGIISGGATAIEGGLELWGATQEMGHLGAKDPDAYAAPWKAGGKIAEGSGTAGGAIFTGEADRDSAEAARYDEIAKEHGNDAQDAGDELSRAERLQDKAAGHMAQIADATIQARLAAVRG